MAARVFCFGTDDCNRSLVLREVGYEVDPCRSLIEFRALIHERADADAVLITDDQLMTGAKWSHLPVSIPVLVWFYSTTPTGTQVGMSLISSFLR